MSQQQRSASALGGRTARACDNCIRRRARWFCAADDAFLCQACDSSVHSANPLASRHDRVRLNASSSSSSHNPIDVAPTWHHGFTRKPRTPRKPSCTTTPKPAPLVPDLEIEVENSTEEEQLLYRVPIFDPALAEFCSPPPLDDTIITNSESKPATQTPEYSDINLVDFQPSEVEIAEFESLLGQGFDDEQFCMESLGLVEVREGEDVGCCQMVDDGCVKLEFEMDVKFDYQLVPEKMETYSDEAKMDVGEELVGMVQVEAESERALMLRLDYDGVVSAWAGRGCSPWIDGQRPQLSQDVCWPDYMGMYGDMGHMAAPAMDGGREARVSRYREKRRTRLFSKKIRYEVRKLNAEKRPRMKGRFVKRSSAAASSFPY